MIKLRKTMLLSSLLLLSSCGLENINKVAISKTGANRGTLIEIVNDTSRFETLIDDKENFLVALYLDPFCGCWVTFRDNVIDTYVQDFNVDIYTVHLDLFSNDQFGIPFDISIDNTVVFALYESGHYTYGTVNYKERSVFQNYNEFKTWIDRYIIIV